jgi:predicted DCC family thiol-disulfide oxidoreductase YuxK
MLRVAYDGQCVVCNGSRRLIEALDWLNRVEWIDLHDRAKVDALFPGLDRAAAMGQVHVRDRHQREYQGFFGTRRMLREVPLGFPLWLLLRLPGMTWLGQRIYRFIARHRYQINRLFGVPVCADDTCRIH